MHRLIVPLTAALALFVSACGGSADTKDATGGGGGSGGAKLSLVAYSTPEVVYDEIIPLFQKTDAGAGVSFKESYGASGEQSRAVEAGLDADVVALSLEPDVTRLVKAGLVQDGWADAPHKGLVSTSLVSFIVRKGNPKNIRTWEDLLKPGVEVINANPFTSGGAKWNVLGAYAHGGIDYVRELITKHIKVQPKSAREALQTFIGGKGDVLLSYENEAILAQKKGEKVDFVTPPDTFLIENPIAVTSDAPAAAKKFIEFAISTAGQERFAEWGYRPVDEAVLKAHASDFPEPSKLTTVADLGGWAKLNDELFDPEKGSVAKIEEDAGVSTAK